MTAKDEHQFTGVQAHMIGDVITDFVKPMCSCGWVCPNPVADDKAELAWKQHAGLWP